MYNAFLFLCSIIVLVFFLQELQHEVTSLLEFRDNVLQAFPHLQARAYHSLTPTHVHDHPSSQASQPLQAVPATRGVSSPSKSSDAPHHVTSGDGRQQRPMSSSAGVTTTGNSGNNSSSSSTGGKSLSETHSSSAVADSGFSTDKAGGSMGKSSSSSAGDHLSGVEEHRWTSVEPELPLGSAEDELLQLLEVIQRKGTRLRNELERAERMEQDRLNQQPPPGSSASDPLASPRPHPAYRDYWPHSLPGPIGHYHSRGDVLAPPPPPPPVGMAMEAEAWAAVDRLRQDRQYLVGRVSWAEAEAAASHQRLLDLHGQLLALAGDKRRLEDQVRALRFDPRLDPRVESRVDYGNDLNLQFVKTNGVRRDGPASTGGIVHSVMGGVNTVHIVSDNTTATTTTANFSKPRRVPPAVTVSVASGDGTEESHCAGPTARGRMIRSASSVRINSDRDIFLPRVLKVPIRDRTQRHSNKEYNTASSQKDNSSKDQNACYKDPSSASENVNVKDSAFASATDAVKKGSDRVVIERERRAGKADGGFSMPVSLLKGARLKVQPNKQRISAILREKDVLELQRQLLTTVMETEVLRKQIETASEEWVSKTAEWEAEHRHTHSTIIALREQNLSLKTQLEHRERTEQKDIGINVCPLMFSISTMTEGGEADSAEAATHTVHPGPNIKYDVVVHQEESRRSETNNNSVNSASSESGNRKVPLAVEKPPRRSRETRSASTVGTLNAHVPYHGGGNLCHRESTGSEVSGGRDSIGRGAGPRSRPNLVHSGRATPTGTPRTSPAPSINSRVCTTRISPQEGGRATSLGRSNSGANSRVVIGRRDSIKTTQTNVKGNGKSSPGVGGQHKASPACCSDQSIISKSSTVMSSDCSSQQLFFLNSSLDFSSSPLNLSDLQSSSPATSYDSATPKKIFTANGQKKLRNFSWNVNKAAQRRLSTGCLYNEDLNDVTNINVSDSKLSYAGGKTSLKCENESSTASSELRLSNLKSGSNSSSLGSGSSFYDSINTDAENMGSGNKLMHVEVAFEWNPIPSQKIQYLPPAGHVWTPAHMLSSDKHLPPVTSILHRWPTPTKIPIVHPHGDSFKRKKGSLSEKIPKCVDRESNAQQWMADSLEDENQGFDAIGKMKGKLRVMNGAVRVKSVDRPSVLSMVQETSSSYSESTLGRNMISSPKSSTNIQANKVSESCDKRTSDLDGSRMHLGQPQASLLKEGGSPARYTDTDDLNSRVHQILARIAGSAQ
ncbi:uncharacterized protein [Cherax quadricarinatus]|uniref:uncharacterized protein n=1 Tax=Cherax quadricarinatus TaxID=27406 RepID=UPI00387E6C8A